MQNTKLNIPVTPEIALAIEAGVKDALSDLFPKGEEPRKKVASDQKLKGLAIDLRLEIAEVSVGHDTDKTPTINLPWLSTVALLLKRAGYSREEAKSVFLSSLQEALTLNKEAAETLFNETGAREVEKEVKDGLLAKTPRIPVAKSVKAVGTRLTLLGVSQPQ